MRGQSVSVMNRKKFIHVQLKLRKEGSSVYKSRNCIIVQVSWFKLVNGKYLKFDCFLNCPIANFLRFGLSLLSKMNYWSFFLALLN